MKTKEKILKVAQEEFATYGYDAVSMNNLVKKLEINKATIYYHFEDKKSLYYEVIRNAMDKLNSNIKEAFENKDEEKLIKKYVNAYIQTLKDNPNIVPIALREIANYGANMDESFIPHVEEELKYLKIAIDELDLEEKYKHMNIYSLYSFINGTIKTFYAIQMSSLPLGADEELKQNSDKTLDYISKFVTNIIVDAIAKK